MGAHRNPRAYSLSARDLVPDLKDVIHRLSSTRGESRDQNWKQHIINLILAVILHVDNVSLEDADYFDRDVGA